MNLDIYDIKMNRILFIDRYSSLLWQEGYDTQGMFSLELPASKDYIKLLRPDCYVARRDRDTVMVITSVTVKKGVITATGKMATWILSNIAYIGEIKTPVAIGTAVESTFLTAIENHPKHNYPALKLALPLDFSYEYGKSKIGSGSLLDIYSNLCKAADAGLKIAKVKTASGAELHIKFYKPQTPKSNVVFSPSYGNMGDYSITWSTEKYKNYALVESEGSATGYASDENALVYRDVIVTASDGENAEAAARDELENAADILNVKFTPSAVGFGTEYDLGDTVKIILNEYDLILTARVIQYSLKEQRNSSVTNIVVGSPTIIRR